MCSLLLSDTNMWRWPVIAGKKAAKSAAKGKVFAIHSKLIAVAARSGSNPDENPVLRDLVEKARKDSVTKEVIERAIARGAGLDKDASEIVEITYEWYAQGGAWVIVRTLTDNKNRTASNIRTAFSKHSGNLWDPGALTAHMFQLVGQIVIETVEDIEEWVIDSGAEDYVIQDGIYTITTPLDALTSSVQYLQDKWCTIASSGREYISAIESEVTDFDQALKLVKLLEVLDEDEDVEKIWTNAIIDDTLRSKVDAYIEEKTFKT